MPPGRLPQKVFHREKVPGKSGSPCLDRCPYDLAPYKWKKMDGWRVPSSPVLQFGPTISCSLTHTLFKNILQKSKVYSRDVCHDIANRLDNKNQLIMRLDTSISDDKLMRIDGTAVLGYDNVTSTPLPQTRWVRPPQPPVSTIVQESLLDRDADFSMKGVEKFSSGSSGEEQTSGPYKKARPSTSRDEPVEDIDEEEFNNLQNTIIDWDDETWTPEMESQTQSSSEEDETKEVDSASDDSQDLEYIPPICLRAGGAQKQPFCVDTLPQITLPTSGRKTLKGSLMD
ncbi:uncharacterized protein LOC129407494 [Boleophthalmus pectinirostris]|uniref:uncharacterized protein LOC129407494 n=1 Tax=Boleophthalmus pectinirostris TaxID=150288 RepID=UPI002431FDD0|nr:uncharacterized protein LOC129407494 [Boleophthalmus pectinirostris]